MSVGDKLGLDRGVEIVDVVAEEIKEGNLHKRRAGLVKQRRNNMLAAIAEKLPDAEPTVLLPKAQKPKGNLKNLTTGRWMDAPDGKRIFVRNNETIEDAIKRRNPNMARAYPRKEERQKQDAFDVLVEQTPEEHEATPDFKGENLNVRIQKHIRASSRKLVKTAIELAFGVWVEKEVRGQPGVLKVYQTPPDREILLYLLDQYYGRSRQEKPKVNDEDKEIRFTIRDV